MMDARPSRQGRGGQARRPADGRRALQAHAPAPGGEDVAGQRVQRAEVRFDDVAGCLRVPTGGSSRQTIMIVDGDKIRSRLLSAREAARLMGLPDTYKLPRQYNDAYALCGDGVVVPVVRYLAHFLDRTHPEFAVRPGRRARPRALRGNLKEETSIMEMIPKPEPGRVSPL